MSLSRLTLKPFSRRTFGFGSVTPLRRFHRDNYFPHKAVPSSNFWKLLVVGGVLIGATIFANEADAAASVDYNAVREDINKILDDPSWEDGSWGPILVRLAWHASGTYDKKTNTGGSDGATMRYEPESKWGANAGLHYAREKLEAIKKKYPGITYADLWSLAGVVAIEHMNGPKINWRPGRSDKQDGTKSPPDGRLPDADKGADHIRGIFHRMGFSDREIVVLAGAHALGRCHRDRSGYDGPWTQSPTIFSNDYYVQLLENKWTKKNWNGPLQYEDSTKTLMMLPADLALMQDPEFKKYVEIYAKDEDLFFKEFAAAFQKLNELGVNFPKPWYQFW